MSETVDKNTTQIADLVKAANQDGENIAALAGLPGTQTPHNESGRR